MKRTPDNTVRVHVIGVNDILHTAIMKRTPDNTVRVHVIGVNDILHAAIMKRTPDNTVRTYMSLESMKMSSNVSMLASSL